MRSVVRSTGSNTAPGGDGDPKLYDRLIGRLVGLIEGDGVSRELRGTAGPALQVVTAARNGGSAYAAAQREAFELWGRGLQRIRDARRQEVVPKGKEELALYDAGSELLKTLLAKGTFPARAWSCANNRYLQELCLHLSKAKDAATERILGVVLDGCDKDHDLDPLIDEAWRGLNLLKLNAELQPYLKQFSDKRNSIAKQKGQEGTLSLLLLAEELFQELAAVGMEVEAAFNAAKQTAAAKAFLGLKALQNQEQSPDSKRRIMNEFLLSVSEGEDPSATLLRLQHENEDGEAGNGALRDQTAGSGGRRGGRDGRGDEH